MSPAPSPKSVTAEEFMARYGNCRVELIRGVVHLTGLGRWPNGTVCARIGELLTHFVSRHGLGVIADAGSAVVPVRDSEIVRSVDLAYYSHARLPNGHSPGRVISTTPELIVEVRSASDDLTGLVVEVGEYLAAGVLAVIVIDKSRRTASVYRPGGGQEVFADAGRLTVPDVLPGFSVPVARLFP